MQESTRPAAKSPPVARRAIHQSTSFAAAASAAATSTTSPAVATTTTPENVSALLVPALGPEAMARFEVIGAGAAAIACVELLKAMGATHGVLVDVVAPGGPAEKAGIKPDDIIAARDMVEKSPALVTPMTT